MLIGSPEGHAAIRVIERLRASGFRALLVGGCVRDLLLGTPPQDFDVATDARPDAVLSIFPGSKAVGAHFGVVLVGDTEVATFRSDNAYRDGRRPESVQFLSEPEADARRRDFTINALMLDPLSGEVYDYVGGRRDLDSRTLRAIGDPLERFREDHLRMLRAVRFAARLGFTLHPQTFEAIRAERSSIRLIAAERVRDELVRILTEGGARTGFELLDQTGLLELILPEVAAMKGVAQPPEYHPEGDVWTHTLMLLEQLHHPTPTLALGALLHDVGKPPTFRIADRIRFDGHAETGAAIAAAIMTRFRFAHHEIEEVRELVAQHMKFKDVRQMRDATLKRFLRLPAFDQHLELHRIDCQASHGNLENYAFIGKKLAEYSREVLEPAPLLRGGDLIELGYAPGPLFGEILRAVEDAQLEGALQTREEALAFVRSRWLQGTVGEHGEDQNSHDGQDAGRSHEL
ncbi:MAG: CCA tRNA nucleotidyltransferase [Bryobacteraceae bacterium]|nr:CCA tRNA nucleotidyltransferase [Bryobacteraceae bacterium]